MKFNYVIENVVTVSDGDFEEMINYLREYPNDIYENAVYATLENAYEIESIDEVMDDVVEELKKRDSKDKEKGNVYLTNDELEMVNDFFKLIDTACEKSDGKRTFSEIINKFSEMYNSNKNEFDSYAYGVKKIEF